jgi:hypothetical protein
MDYDEGFDGLDGLGVTKKNLKKRRAEAMERLRKSAAAKGGVKASGGRPRRQRNKSILGWDDDGLGGDGSLNGLGDLNESVTDIVKSINDLAVNVASIVKKDPKQPNIIVTTDKKTNWIPWVVGGIAVLGIGAVIMKVTKKK